MRKAWVITYSDKVSFDEWQAGTVLGIPQYKIVEADTIWDAINNSKIGHRYIISMGWAMIAI